MILLIKSSLAFFYLTLNMDQLSWITKKDKTFFSPTISNWLSSPIDLEVFFSDTKPP